MGVKHGDNGRAEMRRRDVLGARLNNAGPARPRKSKRDAEVEIVRKHDRVIAARPLHDLFVAGVRRANGGPVHRLMSVFPKQRKPVRRQIHINYKLHATRSGTSNSSTRQAA